MASLSIHTSLDISDSFNDFSGDRDEAEWRAETLTVCRKNIRKHVAPLVHSLVGIFEQYSGLNGELDVNQIVADLDVISKKVEEFSSSVRLTSALLETQFSLVSVCKDITESVHSILDSLPKPQQSKSLCFFFLLLFL